MTEAPEKRFLPARVAANGGTSESWTSDQNRLAS